MPKYEALSKRELVETLQRLEARPRAGPESDRLIHELQVHQIELEMQNRELREAQRLVEESRHRYAELYDFAPVVYCTLDRDSRIIEANLAAVSLFGLERGALVGKRLVSFVSKPDRRLLLTHLDASFENRGRTSIEITLAIPGLASIVVHAVCTPTESRGPVTTVKMTLTDITAIRRSKERLLLLAQASELLASSFDTAANLARLAQVLVPQFADLCFVDVAEEGQLRRAGVALADPNRQGISRALYYTLTPASGRSAQAEVLRTGLAITLLECTGAMLRASGLHYEAAIEASGPRSLMLLPLMAQQKTLGVLTLVMAESGRLFAAADLVVAQDIASRAAMALDGARLYREAQEATRARQEILAIVSHDLRSPLMTVSLNADLVSRAMKKITQFTEDARLDAITRAVRQMGGLIDDLLDTSSIDAGQLAIERAEHDLNRLLHEAFETFLPRAQDKDVHLRVDLLPGKVAVFCDRARVQQVLANLLGNAIKFTPAGGSVTVFGNVEDRHVRVAVRDTGPGIPEPMLGHVFERYWQAKATAKMGRGLGLFIAQSIITAQRGNIWVESKEGAGATFFFTLPRAALGESPGSKAARTRGVALVIDDETDARAALGDALTADGYSVVPAGNGREAMDYLHSAQRKPDLIVLDLEMPVMDGSRVLTELKGDAVLAGIPVYVISGRHRSNEATSLGAAGYFDKPVQLKELIRALENHADSPPVPA